MHILLVEDDDRVAAALRPALHRHGITTTRLARGKGATDHLAGVDVVLLDLGLPDIDGVDVCRAIREVSEVPVIVVSARGEVDDRILGLHSGADDYLVKPYDIGELLARVHAVLPAPSPRPRLRDRRRRGGRRRARWTWSATRSRWRASPSRSPARSSRCSGCSRRRGGRCARAAGSSPRCGAAPGRGRTGRWTCTSRRCAPSSAARSWCRPCAGVGYRLGLPDTGDARGVVRTRLLVIVLVLVGLLAVGPRRAAGAVDVAGRGSRSCSPSSSPTPSSTPRWRSGRSRRPTPQASRPSCSATTRCTASPCSSTTARAG